MEEVREIVILNSPFWAFVAHLESKGKMRFDGKVYQVTEDSEGYHYFSKTTGATGIHKDLCDDSRLMFSFILEWRGVWEGRIYFAENEEYWSEELSNINEFWKQLEEKLIVQIKKQNPGYKFE